MTTMFPFGTFPNIWTLLIFLLFLATVRQQLQLLSISTIVNLSHWSPTFVYNTLTVTQGLARSVSDSWAFCQQTLDKGRLEEYGQPMNDGVSLGMLPC